MGFWEKKKQVWLCLGLICLQCALYAQEETFSFDRRILYQISYWADSTDQNSVHNEAAELLLNDSISLFRTLYKADMDDQYLNPPEIPSPTVLGAININKSNYQIIKRKSEEIKVYDEYSGSDLKDLTELNYYIEHVDSRKWVIAEDTLRILGFDCQKATIEYGGRIWNAWFTTNIPIADGPYKFCGLPGLIVAIYDASETWRFSLTEIKEFKQNITINVKKDLKLIKINKEKLFSLRKKHQQDLLHIGLSIRQTYGEPDISQRRNMQESIEKDNNWIELYP